MSSRTSELVALRPACQLACGMNGISGEKDADLLIDHVSASHCMSYAAMGLDCTSHHVHLGLSTTASQDTNRMSSERENMVTRY